MEVEFLSNMRYSLLASKEQWEEWQKKLGRFWEYCDLASKAPLPSLSPQVFAGQQTTLPSPPASMQASPPSTTTLYPSSTGSSYNQQWPANTYVAPLVSPLPPMPELDTRHLNRKRSYDGDADEPAAKRITRAYSNAPIPFTTMPPLRQDAPRLPVPNLTISTSQPMSSNGAPSFSQHLPVLPPLSGRAMSSVYASHPSTPSWTPQLPLPSQQSHNGNGYVTPSRRHSPIGSSPTNYNHYSPNFFLQNRNSPYKPVQRVKTLLYPPPSASMHGHFASTDQMHWQSLGKRNEYQTGVVPAFQQFPVLPTPQPFRQPNFHA
jgi:hypothetical protein